MLTQIPSNHDSQRNPLTVFEAMQRPDCAQIIGAFGFQKKPSAATLLSEEPQ